MLHVLFDCAVSGLIWLGLFYLIQPEGKFTLLFFFLLVF